MDSKYFHLHFQAYANNLLTVLQDNDVEDNLKVLTETLFNTWGKQNIYICGNGGSAANASHIANDLIYGAGETNGIGLRVEALSSNSAVLTCLANDTGYKNIFSEQLRVKANKKDILIVLSGSGNSENIINAVNVAKHLKMETFGILGYDGGFCKDIVDYPIHFKVDDMQIAEDMQLVAMHICMQWLCQQKI